MAATNRIDTAEIGFVAVITLFGEHDLATFPALDDVARRLARPGAAVVFDLTPATFIDSTVLGVFVTAAHNADTLVVVAPPRAPCRRVIELVGLDRFLTICDSIDQAVETSVRLHTSRSQAGDR